LTKISGPAIILEIKIRDEVMKVFFFGLSLALFLSGIAFTGCEGGDNSSRMVPRDIHLNTVYNETIASYGTRVYRILTTTSGSYAISLTNLASDLGWTLCSYDASDDSPDDLVDNVLDNDNGDQHADTTSEVYAEILDAGTYYYIVVDEYDDAGPSSYTLQVTH
jgi:hypothetical protein